jgi:hypothetical protein
LSLWRPWKAGLSDDRIEYCVEDVLIQLRKHCIELDTLDAASNMPESDDFLTLDEKRATQYPGQEHFKKVSGQTLVCVTRVLSVCHSNLELVLNILGRAGVRSRANRTDHFPTPNMSQ